MQIQHRLKRTERERERESKRDIEEEEEEEDGGAISNLIVSRGGQNKKSIHRRENIYAGTKVKKKRWQQKLAVDDRRREMDSKRLKIFRFNDRSTEQSLSSGQKSDFEHPRSFRTTVGRVLERLRGRFDRGSERIKSFKKLKSIPYVGDQPKKVPAPTPKKTILDPQGQFLQTWNKVFVLSCVISVAVDPVFFYIPVIQENHNKDKNEDYKCLDADEKLATIACVLRSLFDAFYVLHIIFQFRTGFIAPSSQVFGRGETITDPVAIAKRYLSTYFLIDILECQFYSDGCVLLPFQVVVCVIIFTKKTKAPSIMKQMLKLVIFSQYVPRLSRLYPLYMEVTRASGILTQTAWAGAAYNLFLYMLASHVVGAFWYLFAIEREGACWEEHCHDYIECGGNLPCGQGLCKRLRKCLNETCRYTKPEDIENATDFNFGIFTDILKSGLVLHTADFKAKLSYCFWWAFRNLGCAGQNLETSTYIGEIVFAVAISTFGLVLFSLLIGNMQRYLQSTTMRVEEMRVKRTDAERWMSHRMLPEELRVRVRRYQQYKWQLTRGVEEENLLQSLPKDLRRDITRHLCLSLLKSVPMFEKMDSQLFDALCDRLKPVLHTEKSCIILEGDPVDEMLFIMRGNLTTITTNAGEKGNAGDLKAGDFCGEELFAWALNPRSSTSLPISTRTVIAQTEVEAFALRAADLKFVASQFRRLHSKQFQHIFRQVFKLSLSTFWMIIVNILQMTLKKNYIRTLITFIFPSGMIPKCNCAMMTFRFYSLQWKTWAARRIQAVWRRYQERKLYKSLHEAEDRLQYGVTDEAGTSKVEHNGGEGKAPKRLLLLPQKPDEPNFIGED
ncbi:cyclic nucleotide-gated ion channel 1 [Quercus suber]|uniref:Cyclic nucleotide-gated ion channel 1 n=1 Tax=Quercus suber TaxID=58331 RepID=A0AAW0LTP7_QUESU